MKKVIRLTESDLVRIVKRVISEQSPFFQTPETVFISSVRRLGMVPMWADKNGKLLDGNYSNENYYVYIGKPGTKNWKYVRYSTEDNPEYFDLQSPSWKPVTSQKTLSDLNQKAWRKSDSRYSYLERNPEVEDIRDMILQGEKKIGDKFNDDEAEVEAGFMAIGSIQKYNEVKKLLGQDPYKYAKSFMDTSKVYHKKSIDSSMRRLGLLK